MDNKYEPKPENKFTFGLWTVGNTGSDPFGGNVREQKSPVELVYLLAEVGAYGVNFHDNDLVPIDASPAESDKIKATFKKALADTGLVVPMVTTNLFYDPVFRDGAFTSNNAKVRNFAIQKSMKAIDIVINNGYGMKFALEAKPNEPRGNLYNATTGHMLAFIESLDHPEMVGVNPELAHEHMAGLNFAHSVAQAIDAGKLFHIDLNDQAFGRYDQDFRFGAVDLKSAFFLVKLLEDHGYTGSRHFDAHAFRTEDYEGVKDFARGCMRTYLILKEKASRFNADIEIQALLKEINKEDSMLSNLSGKFTPEKMKNLKEFAFDRKALSEEGLMYEKLDQLTNEILLGVR
jgi:xylose isomerase